MVAVSSNSNINFQDIIKNHPCQSQVQQEFHKVGLMTDVDLDPGSTLNKKIRNAQLAQYNFILGEWSRITCKLQI